MRSFALFVALLIAFPIVVQGDAPLTNEEVIKLCSAGLGDEIVIAKIEGATKTAFNLETDALIQLKKAGVSQPVLAAMLRKASGRPAPGTAPLATAPAAAAAAEQDDPPLLEAKDGERSLMIASSRFNARGFGPIKLVQLEIAGYSSRTKTTDRRPSLLVRFDYEPQTFFFIVRADADKGDNSRSIKMGSAVQHLKKMFEDNPRYFPDADHAEAYNAEELSPGVWRITPQGELAPGEYGLYFSSDFTSKYRGADTAIYDFAIVE